MQVFKVYHTRNWSLNSNLHFRKNTQGYKPFKSNYKLVAEVDSEEIGEVFSLTNHIDTAWWENKGVVLVEESRSTSVGDLIETNDGKLFLVVSIGFKEVQWADDENDPYEIKKDEFGEYKVPKTS